MLRQTQCLAVGLDFWVIVFLIDLLNSHLSWPKLYFSFFVFFSNKVQWMVVFPIENIVRRLFLTWLVNSLFHASFFFFRVLVKQMVEGLPMGILQVSGIWLWFRYDSYYFFYGKRITWSPKPILVGNCIQFQINFVACAMPYTCTMHFYNPNKIVKSYPLL